MSQSEKPEETAPGSPAADSGLPPVAPDIAEQEAGSAIDNVIPTKGYKLAPLIGLGGSAGSIKELQAFFRAMPGDSGMSFVVVVHLPENEDSALTEILQRETAMSVRRATNGVKLQPDHVYVIVPGTLLQITDGHLRVMQWDGAVHRGFSVDFLFRTLADTHGAHAAGIVLSGADGDGALGIKRLKERGGLTIAQDPAEAQYPSMPRGAVDTGMVDWVLRVAEIPQKLVAYFAHEQRMKVPPEDGPQPAAIQPKADDENEAALRDVLVFLRTRTGCDFSYYKRATILRRIVRRMQVNSVHDLPAYLAFLRTHSGEPEALLQDLLISVTNFFRDRDAWRALEAEIPAIIDGKRSGESVRVWSAACATGEEAYSLAILLLEHTRKMDSPPAVQVFGCDLDEEAIQVARAGVYPDSIAADVPEEYLRRYFTKEFGGYRVRRELREVVLFAAHDLLRDAPFSRMDLISCRNLMIYLNRDAQRRALEIFHFAMRPQGRLFLGSSESVDDTSELFAALDKKYRIYAHVPSARPNLPVTGAPTMLIRALAAQESSRNAPVPPGQGFFRADSPTYQIQPPAAHSERQVLAEMHAHLIERYAAPSVIVNQNHDIVHISESAGRFLQFASGEPTMNLLRVVSPEVRIQLRAALFRANETGNPVELSRVKVEEAGNRVLDIRVAPAKEIAPGFLLVIFFERGPRDGESEEMMTVESEPVARHLERELEGMKSHLRDTVEQYEASCEELKASNEELQAMNEELRSATEELETSREEQQSINEELITVNQELKIKVDELGNTNSDLHNLMASTAIATFFLDRELRVMRYTPPAVSIFRLIPSDAGREITDLAQRVEYPNLQEDAKSVLTSLVPTDREVRDSQGRWFIARILPYRTLDDRIGGVVLTFVDITERKNAEQAMELSEARLGAIFNQASIGLSELSLEGRFQQVNPDLCRMLGRTQEEMLQLTAMEVTHPDDLVFCTAAIQRVVETGKPEVVEKRFLKPDGTVVWAHSTITRVDADSLQVKRLLAVTADLTERRKAESALAGYQEQLRLIMENARDYAIFTMDLQRRVTSWNVGAERLVGWTENEVKGRSGDVIFTPEDRSAGAPELEQKEAVTNGRAADERWHVRKDGTRFWGSGSMMSMHDAAGKVVGLVKIFRDETERRNAKTALEQSRHELMAALEDNQRARAEVEAAAAAKDQFLAVLSHELRTPLTPVLMSVHGLLKRPDLPAPARQAIEMIERNVKIEAHFIDDLLDVTRISRGKLEITREPVEVHEIVRSAIEIVQHDIAAKSQRLTVMLSAPETKLSGDPVRLKQAVWNLLKNAAKFTPEGGTITISTRNEAGAIQIEVKDTGIGMTNEEMARIFDAFSQGSENIHRVYGGLGLGLAIVKATVEAHGGTLAASSDGHGKGSTFLVTLPLETPDSKPAS